MEASFLSDQESDVNALIATMRQELSDLKRTVASQRDRLNSFGRELIELREIIPVEVRLSEKFPDLTACKLILAQLFHNQSNTSGKHGGWHPPEWNLKVGFWVESDNIKLYKNGTIEAMCFNLHKPDDDERGADLIGCRNVKGSGRDAKGTRLFVDQIAAIYWSTSDGRYPAHTLTIESNTWPEPLTLSDPYIIPDDKRTPTTPIMTWTYPAKLAH